jgi:hypothetical protein
MTTRRETRVSQRIFVSSVVEGFGEFREAAREGVVAAGGEPVLVNEDFPSLIASSRNACLDAVDSCDFLISIVGRRGGWTTPSGLLVIEEEYQEARRKRIPVLAFLQKGSRDADAEQFAHVLSDYVNGTFRQSFASPEDLREAIQRSLTPLLLDQFGRSMTRQPMADRFSSPLRLPYATTVRLALFPERDEEVVDPVRLGSEEFLNRVYELGHSGNVRLFNYQYPKTAEVRGSSLVVQQAEIGGSHGEGERVRLEIAESGELIVDANVTGRMRRGGQHDMLSSMIVAIEDIESVLDAGFRFVTAFYEDVDRFKRHQRFLYNVGLSGLEHRTLERNPQSRTSYGMSMRSRDSVILAFDTPRLIDRAALLQPRGEIDRVTVLLTRKASS